MSHNRTKLFSLLLLHSAPLAKLMLLRIHLNSYQKKKKRGGNGKLLDFLPWFPWLLCYYTFANKLDKIRKSFNFEMMHYSLLCSIFFSLNMFPLLRLLSQNYTRYSMKFVISLFPILLPRLKGNEQKFRTPYFMLDPFYFILLPFIRLNKVTVVSSLYI